jgi:hypothetical protein
MTEHVHGDSVACEESKFSEARPGNFHPVKRSVPGPLTVHFHALSAPAFGSAMGWKTFGNFRESETVSVAETFRKRKDRT